MTDIRKQVKHTLVEPVVIEGRTVTELVFRRIKGKDIRDMEREDSGLYKTAFMIGRLSGMPPELFDEMDGEDIEAVGKIIEGFMGRKVRRRA